MSSKDRFNDNSSNLYYTLLEAAAKNKPPDVLMRQNWINMMITRVEEAKKLIESNDGDLHPKVKEALLNYKVHEVTSPNAVKEKKLFVKTGKGVLCEAIPLTKTYPIVLKAHIMTKHGEEAQMAEWILQSKRAVAPICYAPFLDSCTVCKHKGNIPISHNPEQIKITPPKVNKENSSQLSTITKANNEIGYITMLDMALANNNEKLNTLLIYKDDRTNFILLRPVCSSDMIDSTCSELLHIFSDINPPKYLVVPTSMSVIIKQVLERLNAIFDPDIEMKTKDVVESDLVITVNNALCNYLNKTDEANWCVGCYIVQWELNNMRGNDGKSPFEKVFGQSVDSSVVISNFNLLDINNLATSVDNLQIDGPNADLDEFIKGNSVLEVPLEIML